MPMAQVGPEVRSIAASAALMRRRAGDIAVVKASSVALVPLAPAARAEPASLRVNRPDPSFVTHLIATEQQSPQTRTLRRAATVDVQAAYRAGGSLADQNAPQDRYAGIRMRLTA